MKTFIRGLSKAFIYIFITAVLAGILVGGVGGLFMMARAAAPWVVLAGLIIYGLIKLADKAEAAEAEENQSLNLARAMQAAREGNNGDSGPIIP